MLYQCLADLFSKPVHQLDDFGRQAGFQKNLDEEGTGVGYVLGRLEHHAVPAKQGREDLPGGDRHGKVERCDHPAHADWTPNAHRPLIAQLGRHGVTEEASPFRARVVSSVDAFLHIAPGLREHLTHLPGRGLSQLFLAGRHKVSGPPHDITALRSRSATPDLVPSSCGGHRALHVFRARAREASNQVRDSRGIAILEVVTRRWGYPGSFDEILEVF